MQHFDERILEHLSEAICLSPELFAFHVAATPSLIAERLHVMVRLGYVVPTIDGDDLEKATMRELGPWGEHYLAEKWMQNFMWPAPAPRPLGRVGRWVSDRSHSLPPK